MSLRSDVFLKSSVKSMSLCMRLKSLCRVSLKNLFPVLFLFPYTHTPDPLLLSLLAQSSEVVEQILHTVSKSSSLEELTLENAGLKA